jgi:hypothetical protein
MNTKPILVEIPARFKRAAEALGKLVEILGKADQTLRIVGSPVDYGAIERDVAGAVAEVERGSHEDLLQRLDTDAPRVEIQGKLYTRIGRTMGHYRTLAGEIVLERSVYRQLGVRNGPTVDAISLRSGAIGDGWLPQTARAMAHLLQQGTSREAEVTSREMGRLPYSRASFERVPHELGQILVEHHVDIEDTLAQKFEVPEEATSISASIDRVSVPMEEPRKRPVGRPHQDAPKHPVERNFRMAWCGTVTFHDHNGEALHTVRCGRMPEGDSRGMCLGLANEVYWALQKRSDLELTLLADGAPDIWDLLEEHFSEEMMGKKAHRLIDFWHTVEKLAPAAEAIYGEEAGPVLKRWRSLLRRRSSAAADILAELEDSGCEESKAARNHPVHDAITYLVNNGHRMNYARARRHHLPIGSGNVEATCKSLIGTRMKRPGSRWKHKTGDHVVQLRALAQSDRWTEAMHLLLATQRTSVRDAA